MNVIIDTVQLITTISNEVPATDAVGGSGSLGAADNEIVYQNASFKIPTTNTTTVYICTHLSQ